MHDLVADCRALYARERLQLKRKLFEELARAVDGTPTDDDCANVSVGRLEEDFERVVRFERASEDEEVAEAVRLDAPDGFQSEAARGVCRDHSEDLLVADNRADGLEVEAHELGLFPEVFGAARTPVRADGDVDAFRDERLHIERVAVEEQVGDGRPDEVDVAFAKEVDVVWVVGVNAAAMYERERTRTHSRRVLECRMFCQRLELKSRVWVNAFVVSEAGAAF